MPASSTPRDGRFLTVFPHSDAQKKTEAECLRKREYRHRQNSLRTKARECKKLIAKKKHAQRVKETRRDEASQNIKREEKSTQEREKAEKQRIRRQHKKT
jgi:hypothetical protein